MGIESSKTSGDGPPQIGCTGVGLLHSVDNPDGDEVFEGTDPTNGETCLSYAPLAAAPKAVGIGGTGGNGSSSLLGKKSPKFPIRGVVPVGPS